MGARISNLAELMTSRTGKLHSTIGIQEYGEKSQSCFHALILLLDAYLMITGYINILRLNCRDSIVPELS